MSKMSIFLYLTVRFFFLLYSYIFFFDSHSTSKIDIIDKYLIVREKNWLKIDSHYPIIWIFWKMKKHIANVTYINT